MLLRSIIVILLFAAQSLVAQTPAKIISAANKALGGERALRAVNSWQQTGTIRRASDGSAGKFMSAASGGNRFTLSFDVGGFEMALGSNGKSSWMRDSKSGVRTIIGDAGRDFQAEAIFRNTRWLNTKSERLKLAVDGTGMVAGRAANIVALTTAKGVRIRVFFDVANGLPVREEFPSGDGVRTFEYSDYRPVAGVQTAFSVRAIISDEAYDIKLDDVKYNVLVERSAFDYPKISDQPLPDIKQLLDEIRRNADKVDEILENYSYTETRVERSMNPAGQLVEKGSTKRSLTFYKGYRISRNIEKNGRPLSQSDQAQEDREAQKQVAEIEKKVAEKERKQNTQRDASSGSVGQPRGDGQRITIADALKGSLLINPRRERFKGRDVVVFDYEPDPAFKPQTRNEKLFALCTGVVWVDVSTKQVVRLEAVLTKAAGNFIAKAKQGASFSLDNELVNNEIWLPSRADINLSIKILFAGFNINNLIKYGDYRRFDTEVKDVKVGEDKKP